jgi:outer membrane receptor protein involved in Fe transport
MTPRSLARALALVLSPAAAAPLTAQTVPPTSAAPAAPALQLSPFEVTSTQDTGYAGQDTLAGSRLRTNLRDVAAAISPMTAEFLRDIAATNLENAIEYGMGTRMETDDARAAGPVADGYNDGFRSIRIRGLPGGARSINFFDAPGEVDMYMTDRVEVSRGPNSILFGFGSPAGKINVGTKQALTDRNAYSFSHRVDSWGGQRWTADANIVPLKHTLGLRAVLLHGREESWRKAGHNHQDRIFLTAKWRLDRRTTVRVDAEYGKINRAVPRPFWGNDLRSVWDQNGRPIFNNFAATHVPGAPFTPGAAGTPGTPLRDTGATNILGVQERSSGDWVVVSDRFAAAQNYRQFTTAERPAGPLRNDFEMGRRFPEAALEGNWISGRFAVSNVSAFFQRELARDLNLELAANRQGLRRNVHNDLQWDLYGIAADTNRYLPNGQLRPAGDLYYFEMSPNLIFSRAHTTQERITLSYEKSVRDWARLRVAGLGELVQTDSIGGNRQLSWLRGPDVSSGGAFNVTPENAANKVYYRYYLSDLGVLNDPNYRIPAPYTLSGALPYQDPRTGAVTNLYAHEVERAQSVASPLARETGAYMGVAQAFLFQDRLVATYGYRSDRVKNWLGLAVRDPAAEAIARNSGVWLPVDAKSRPATVYSGHTNTLGAVFHVTRWLSAFANTSSSLGTPSINFVAPKDVKQTTGADLTPAPSGETTDYGLKLSLLRNRIFVTATRYHTISKNEFGGSGFNKTNLVNIWTALADSTLLPPDETAFARTQIQVMNQVNGTAQNSESKGYELELVGKPLANWSVSVNYSHNRTLRSNIGREYRAYIDAWKPYWKKYSTLSITQNATQPRPQYAPSSTDWRSPAEATATGAFVLNNDSINESIAAAEQAFFDNPRVFEGMRFVGDPLHNVNLRTRYDFSSGALRGFSVGGGTRLRWGRVAGAKVDYTVPPTADYTDLWNGRVVNRIANATTKDQNVYDLQLAYSRLLLNRKYRWSVQLNINNVANQRELIVNNVHPQTLEPVTYRYQDPRQFILTNTVSF